MLLWRMLQFQAACSGCGSDPEEVDRGNHANGRTARFASGARHRPKINDRSAISAASQVNTPSFSQRAEKQYSTSLRTSCATLRRGLMPALAAKASKQFTKEKRNGSRLIVSHIRPDACTSGVQERRCRCRT